MNARVYPEIVHGRRDGFRQGRWTIEAGAALRGGARCNLSERTLRVPFGVDEVSRVVRAHELIHIRVSPHDGGHTPDDPEISPRALECAEEFRVNLLLARLGFDVALLCDGTERAGGQRLAESNEWGETLCFFLAVLETGAEAAFLKGVRARQPSWLPALRAVKKRVRDLVAPLETSQVGATHINDAGFPDGYARVSVPIALIVSRSMGVAVPVSPEAMRVFRRSLEAGSRRAPSAIFAPLVFDESLKYQARPGRRTARRARAMVSGTVMRYPGRLLTDPQQRAFSGTVPSRGGVVVIDQSGSMDVSVEALEHLLSSAPEALIVGYSHRPGDHGATPNAWILASRGQVVTAPRAGNIGNGVDGPMLRWALSQARHGTAVVWVTDGQVTDSHDHPCHSLTLECAMLVLLHRIRLVRSLDEVESALRRQPVSTSSFGRVGREVELLRKHR